MSINRQEILDSVEGLGRVVTNTEINNIINELQGDISDREFYRRYTILYELVMRLNFQPNYQCIRSGITKKQFDNLQHCKYKKKFGDIDCSICINKVYKNRIVTVLECKHIFHKKCIKEWLGSSKTCPMCRGNVE